jgi:hypothetical protein
LLAAKTQLGTFFADRNTQRELRENSSEQHVKDMPMQQIVSDFLDSGCCSMPFVTVSFGVLLIVALSLVALVSSPEEPSKEE